MAAARLTALLLLAACALTPAAAAEGLCGEVYFVRNKTFWSPFNGVVAEVMLKPEGEPAFRVAGMLFNGDWGVMASCARQVTVRLRWLVEPGFNRRNPRREAGEKELVVKVPPGGRAYVSVSLRALSELAEQEGKRRIDDIEKDVRGAYPLARADFEKDRYGLMCFGCETFRPDDFPLKEQKR